MTCTRLYAVRRDIESAQASIPVLHLAWLIAAAPGSRDGLEATSHVTGLTATAPGSRDGLEATPGGESYFMGGN